MHFSMMKDASPHAKHNTLIHVLVQNEKYSIPIWKNWVLSSWNMMRFTQKQKAKFHLLNNISFKKQRMKFLRRHSVM